LAHSLYYSLPSINLILSSLIFLKLVFSFPSSIKTYLHALKPELNRHFSVFVLTSRVSQNIGYISFSNFGKEMSCNGCRVLRKGCSETCILRPCLQWIESAESQGHATVFVAKFFGRAGLMSFISSVPELQRPGTTSFYHYTIYFYSNI